MSIVPALGSGNISYVPTVWDGQTDSKSSLDLTIDNLQQGDLIEVTLTQSCTGCFQWTGVCRSGDVTFLASNQGVFTGATPTDLSTFEDRSWMVLLQSNAVQSITLGLDHAAYSVSAGTLVASSGGSGISLPVVHLTPGYRLTNVTLAACVIGKIY